MDPDELEKMVRKVVARTLGQRSGRLIVDEELIRTLPAGQPYEVPAGALVTPLARQAALDLQIKLIEGSATPAPKAGVALPGSQTVAIGADHGGFKLKELLKKQLADAHYKVVDCGTHSTDAVDYPDQAYAVARLVADGTAWRGIIIDGAGIGSCMAANKVPGVRAAMCYDQATAVNSREHNNANVLTLGAGLIGDNLAKAIVTTWLTTEFGGGRHGRRVDKIDAIERRYTKR
ncbi:MAG: ribose 5-phosphate isomerase B [Anaerolineales bacterium]|nr:ribose 5-phosphate isomerase B [Anaerolineales bacterium]